MDNHWIIKIIVYLFMFAIVISLGSGLYFILFQRQKGEQAAKALSFRIGLSLVLFILLFIAFAFGWIKPHSLFPAPSSASQK